MPVYQPTVAVSDLPADQPADLPADDDTDMPDSDQGKSSDGASICPLAILGIFRMGGLDSIPQFLVSSLDTEQHINSTRVVLPTIRRSYPLALLRRLAAPMREYVRISEGCSLTNRYINYQISAYQLYSQTRACTILGNHPS
eukprot:7600161-Pyramimonas_sp.AAC.1